MTTPHAQLAPFAGGEPSFPDDAIEVGRVISAWGIQGWIRVQTHASDPKALFSSRRWFVKPPESSALQKPSSPRPQTQPSPRSQVSTFPPLLRITMAKSHGGAVLAAAQEVPDRNAAEAMKGARIFVARSSFPTAGDGEYYWVDLLGLQAVNRRGEALGQVIDLIDTGAHSVLRLRRPDAIEGASAEQSERLIPFVAAYIDTVDLPTQRIVADWGLDY